MSVVLKFLLGAINRNLGLFVVAFSVFFAGLIVSAPASLALPPLKSANLKIGFAHIGGTVWSPHISNLTLGSIFLGDVAASIQLSDLLTGNITYKLHTDSEAVRGKLIVSRSIFGEFTIKTEELLISPGVIGRFRLLGEPIRGVVKFYNVKYGHKGAECTMAAGDVATDILNAPAQQFNMPAVDLHGRLKCADGKLGAVLTGSDSKLGSVHADLSLLSDRQYRLTVSIETMDADVIQAMSIIGFKQRGDVFYYDEIAEFSALNNFKMRLSPASS